MQVRVNASINDIQPSDWNALAGSKYPFLSHAFLAAAEDTGCVSAATGWQPRHLTLEDQGKVLGAMLLYEKTHSWGEFVFDWAWANAYHQAGYPYYPKLVSAVPFTPAPCPKLLLHEAAGPNAARMLIEAGITLARETACSSFHVLFPLEHELQVLEAAGLKTRKDCQFHWHNRGYSDFDDFLATFNARKRKKAKRDRRHVTDSGIRFRHLHGDEIDLELWEKVYRLINLTFMRRGSNHYFDLDFFLRISRDMPRQVLVILAETDCTGETTVADSGGDAGVRSEDGPVAAAVFFESPNALYGRYWGSTGRYNALHFETCYYQGIDYCIRNDIQLFEPGTQGEHKVSRGFIPEPTWSAHWLAHPEFFAAIGDYLELEIDDVERYMQAVEERSPYRRPTE